MFLNACRKTTRSDCLISLLYLTDHRDSPDTGLATTVVSPGDTVTGVSGGVKNDSVVPERVWTSEMAAGEQGGIKPEHV